MKTAILASLLVLFAVPFTASAATYSYLCASYYWNGDNSEKGTMALTLSPKSAVADITEVSWDTSLGGKIKPDYKSRGNVPYVKYGNDLIVEKVMLKGGKKLKDGSYGGFVRVEGEAEGGFFQYKFVCKKY